MANPIRKLAAIMFTDIAGFTALSSVDEEAALKLLDLQREILKPIVDKHNGDWLKEIGDGLLLSFPSSKDAVNCAIKIQHILKEVKNLDLRIGIHQGDILEKGGDIFGDDVNIASRMEPFAAVGGVAISHKVAGDISSSPEFKLKLIGVPKLKGVKQKVRIYCIISQNLPETDISKVSAKLDSEPILTRKTSIAVLPFSAFSSEEEDLFFADGVHDDILTQISKIHDLKVISRTSVVGYKNSTKKIHEIAKELNVKHILEGSVRRAENQVRIVSQLINAVTDEHLWAETYDRDYKDIFAIQSDVAKKIATALKTTLTSEEIEYIYEKPTDNMEAYDYFLKGKYFWNTKWTKEGNLKAVDFFDKAAELDPNFSLAYAWASIVHSILYHILEWDHTQKRKHLSKKALDKAISLEPDHPQVHFAKGFYVNYCLNDFKNASTEFEIAFKAEPNNDEIALNLGLNYRKLGKWKKAEEYIIKSYELNPLSMRAAFYVGIYYQFDRQYHKAQEYFSRAIKLNPEESVSACLGAFNYLDGFGEINKARNLLHEAKSDVSDSSYLFHPLFWTETYARDFHKSLKYAKEYKKTDCTSLNIGRAYFYLCKEKLAKEEFESMRNYFERKIGEDPENALFHSNLGQVFAYLGLKEKAIEEGKKGIELLPVSKNHVEGPEIVTDLVEIYILTGEHELAIENIEYLLSMPSWMTKWSLRLDPVYNPLRDNPRFQQLVVGD